MADRAREPSVGEQRGGGGQEKAIARFTVGSVPYVNAIPLTWRLGEVEVLHAVPSQLPPLLESGAAQAILVSSVDALRVPNRRMVAGVCIGSDGPVKSVRLFSKVPPTEIRRLALDASSMTSNRLAQVLLAERYGTRPEVVILPPSLSAMLAEADACVLIGDIGMRADGQGLVVLDLGAEWTDLTGLPFVWAAWIGNEGLTPELAGLLREARRRAGAGKGFPTSPELVRHTVELSDWPWEMVEDYYGNVMVYDLDDRVLAGLRAYRDRLIENGFSDCHHFPELVTAG